jgi:hypothetical protein
MELDVAARSGSTTDRSRPIGVLRAGDCVVARSSFRDRPRAGCKAQDVQALGRLLREEAIDSIHVRLVEHRLLDLVELRERRVDVPNGFS